MYKLALALCACVAMAACSPTTTGTAAGATAGALVGSPVGAVVGGVGGAAVGGDRGCGRRRSGCTGCPGLLLRLRPERPHDDGCFRSAAASSLLVHRAEKWLRLSGPDHAPFKEVSIGSSQKGKATFGSDAPVVEDLGDKVRTEFSKPQRIPGLIHEGHWHSPYGSIICPFGCRRRHCWSTIF
jgi:hypothetical protein